MGSVVRRADRCPPACGEPVRRHAVSFGADTLVLTAFVIALGIPVYHRFGLDLPVPLIVLYIVSATLVPTFAPLLTFWLRWGRPDRATALAVGWRALAFVVPVLVLGILVVFLGFQMALVGLGVMSFVAGVLLQVASRRFGTGGGRDCMSAVRLLTAVGTPVVVLGLTNALPDGVNAIGGWSLVMPVAVAGAVGGAYGLVAVVPDDREPETPTPTATP